MIITATIFLPLLTYPMWGKILILLICNVANGTSLVAQMVKNLPAVQETWVPSLGGKDLEKGMATQSFQFSCLENFMVRGAWQATVHGVAKSWTRPSN